MAYNPRKAAQTIAYFAMKSGGVLAVLKAVKLVYLADRESMSRYGFPIQDERLVSMPKGPVNSTTLNYINGEMEDAEEKGWTTFLSDRANHEVGLARAEITEDDLDELSDADIQVLESVWSKFGAMDRWKIVEWTHYNIPEWEDPHGTALEIPLERVMKYLEIENADLQAAAVKEQRRLSGILKAC